MSEAEDISTARFSLGMTGDLASKMPSSLFGPQGDILRNPGDVDTERHHNTIQVQDQIPCLPLSPLLG